jgi:hypothetical protein
MCFFCPFLATTLDLTNAHPDHPESMQSISRESTVHTFGFLSTLSEDIGNLAQRLQKRLAFQLSES